MLQKKVDCLTINKSVIVKEYDNLGMTSNISNLKYENAIPMLDLFEKYSKSKLYTSKKFRIKSKIQYFRYLFISNRKIRIKLSDLIFLFLMEI